MYALRTRFKIEILCEFMPPLRKTNTRKVVILAGGMPGYPKRALLPFLAKKGFWVFQPRYRGTWESGGKFLAKSPEQDITDILDTLPQGFTNLWDNKRYTVIPDSAYIIGSSFGGPAALLCSRDKRITKTVAFSPVVDWQQPSKDEPLGPFEHFVREAFGNGYRFTPQDWRKLAKGHFYNPTAHTKELDGKKILIFHSKDDTVVHYKPVKKFAESVQAKLITLPRGGHQGSSLLLKPHIWKKVNRFLTTK